MSDPSHEPNLGDVTKTVCVPVPVKEAFRVFVEEPMDWVPPGHRFLADADLLSIEPREGGRFYERDPHGTEAVHGIVTEWDPPHRLVMTWRIDGNWQPVPDDERASLIELCFTERDPRVTQVVLTHSQFHRHGEAAARIRAAVDGPSPGETLSRYAEAVTRHNPGIPR